VFEGGQESCALPDDPLLTEAASALNEGRAWGIVLDAEWRWVYMSDDGRLSSGSQLGMVPVPLGAHFFGAAAMRFSTPPQAAATTATTSPALKTRRLLTCRTVP
jgi:hypothetical protein